MTSGSLECCLQEAGPRAGQRWLEGGYDVVWSDRQKWDLEDTSKPWEAHRYVLACPD